MEHATTPRPSVWDRVRRNIFVRLTLFFVILVAAYVGLQTLMRHLASAVPEPARPVAGLLLALASSGIMLGLYAALVTLLERRRVDEIAYRRAWPLALTGASMAAGLFAVVYAVLWAAGDAQWRGYNSLDPLLPALSMALISGVGEEVVFRGGVYRIIEDGFGSVVALAVSSLLFGLLHLMNQDATLWGAIAIALEAGLLLGATYLGCRSLWLPIGLHLGWNLTEGGILGAIVSGTGETAGVFAFPLSGSDLMTGGRFGPEASVVTVGVCLLLAAAFIDAAVRRGNWQPLRRRIQQS